MKEHFIIAELANGADRSQSRANNFHFIEHRDSDRDMEDQTEGGFNILVVATTLMILIVFLVGILIVLLPRASSLTSLNSRKSNLPVPLSEIPTISVTEGARERTADNVLSPKVKTPLPELFSLERSVKHSLIRPKRMPLISHTIACDAERVSELLKAGANPRAKDAGGDSALIWAAKSNCLEVAKLLIRYGADLSTRSRNGYTALKWAKQYGHLEMQIFIRKYG